MALNFPSSPQTGDLFTAPNGLQYRYDGSKWVVVPTSDTTAEEALAVAQAADQKADAAIVTANDADANATTALTTANSADAKATTALTTANIADANATTALAAANSATITATDALSTANGVDGKADEAINTANEAETKADSALSTATGANTKADAAIVAADAAASDAATAIVTADAAAATADIANTAANAAVQAASTANTTANNANATATAAADTANTANATATAASVTANNALPKSGGTMTGIINFAADQPGLSEGGQAIVSETVPTTKENGDPLESGDLWWNSDLGILYVYYIDSDSQQWVDTDPGGLPDINPEDLKINLSPTTGSGERPLLLKTSTGGSSEATDDLKYSPNITFNASTNTLTTSGACRLGGEVAVGPISDPGITLNSGGASTFKNSLSVNGSVVVGGTASSSDELTVNGNVTIGKAGVEGGQISLRAGDGTSTQGFIDVNGSDDLRFFSTKADTSFYIGQLSGTGGDLNLYAGGNNRIFVESTGNVGINNTAPAERLDVSGNVKSSSLILNGGATLSPVGNNGDYGNVLIDSANAKGNFAGYSINGEAVFMNELSGDKRYGLFNDTQQEWGLQCFPGGSTKLQFGALTKLTTTNTGVTVTGELNGDVYYKFPKALAGPSDGVAYTVQDKLNSIRFVSDFGADGLTTFDNTGQVTSPSANHDDTPQIQKAIDSLYSEVGGGTVFLDGRYIIKGTLTIHPNIHLCGYGSSPGLFAEADSASVGGFYDKRNLLVLTNQLDAGGEIIETPVIRVARSSRISGVYIIRQGLISPLSGNVNEAAQQVVDNLSAVRYTQSNGTQVRGFCNDGINLVGEDAQVENVVIVGFERAIFGYDCARYFISNVRIDCNSGVYLRIARDVGRCINVHCWAFSSFARGYLNLDSVLNGRQYIRNGWGFRVDDFVDWPIFSGCFTYGYEYGYMQNYGNAYYVACGSDHVPAIPKNRAVDIDSEAIPAAWSYPTDVAAFASFTDLAPVGFWARSKVKDIVYSQCKASGQSVGFWGLINQSGSPSFTDRAFISYDQCGAWSCQKYPFAMITGFYTIQGSMAANLKDQAIKAPVGFYIHQACNGCTLMGSYTQEIATPISDNTSGARFQEFGNMNNTNPFPPQPTLLSSSSHSTHVVAIAPKREGHPYYGAGSTDYFYIPDESYPVGHGGVGRTFTVSDGDIITFDQGGISNEGHPLRIYTDENETSEYTTDVEIAGTPGVSGAYTRITISSSTPSTLYYGCSNHAKMGGEIQK